jgi:sulfite exporter TauE/SafE
MEYLQALIIGLVGSFHCAGMCGPLALALPLKQDSWGTRIFSAAIYNSGRIFTYALLGALFGFLGFGLAFWGLQRWVSIAMGIIMIFSVIFPVIFRKLNIEEAVDGFLSGLKRSLGRLFVVRSYTSVFLIGILNGFLPCGLVYLALAGAIISTGPLAGATYMVLFGIGTLPMMLAIPLAGNFASLSFRSAVKKLIPIIIILVGILFILRGLNLGIPYVSPQIEQSQTAPKCCE